MTGKNVQRNASFLDNGARFCDHRGIKRNLKMTDKIENSEASTKAPYEAPHVTDHGSLEDYTKAGLSNTPGVDLGNS